MNWRSLLSTSLPAALLAAASLPAQTLRVIPPQFATVEGNSRSTYPMGRDQAAIQLLADQPLVAAQPSVIVGLAFRADGSPFNTYGAYTKDYSLHACTTTTAAAQMTLDPVQNRNSAAQTLLFSGPVNVAGATPGVALPHPFATRIPFTTPYPYQPQAGNLLLDFATTNATPPPNSYTLDAAFLRTSGTIAAPIVEIAPGCTNGRNEALRLALDGGLLAGALVTTLTTTRPGAFPVAALFTGVTNRAPGYPLDLGPLGMTGCLAAVAPLVTTLVPENAGTYPPVVWPVPADPSLANLPLYAQAFGWTQAALADSVMSDAEVVMLWPQSPPPITANMIYWIASQNRWFNSPTGAFLVVYELTM